MSQRDKQQSTERHGVGQSGYTAGRVDPDPALERQIQDRNAAHPKDADPKDAQVGADDRFTGRGARPWAPAKPEAEDSKDSKNSKE